MTSAYIRYQKSRRIKHPFDFEVEGNPGLDSDTWWGCYRLACDRGGDLSPSCVPPRTGTSHVYLFLRLRSLDDAIALETEISRYLTRAGYTVLSEVMS
jgi:hypothetical protein